MNLNDFVIADRSGLTVRFNDKKMANLEDLLNTMLNHPPTVDYFLERLYFVRDNRRNSAVMDAYIEKELGGYWEEEYLKDHGLEYGWFSFFSYNLGGEVYTDHFIETIYIINDYVSEQPVTEIPFNEFISIFEQYKKSSEAFLAFRSLPWWKRLTQRWKGFVPGK